MTESKKPPSIPLIERWLRNSTPEQRQERARRAVTARWARLTPEQRSEWRRNRGGRRAVVQDAAAAVRLPGGGWTQEPGPAAEQTEGEG